MGESNASLVTVSDIFGVGKIAESAAAKRLADAVCHGAGRLVNPWFLKRETRTILQLQKEASDSLSNRFSG